MRKAGTFRALRRGRLEGAKPLRSFLTPALSRGTTPNRRPAILHRRLLVWQVREDAPDGHLHVLQAADAAQTPSRMQVSDGLHVSRHNMVVGAILSLAKGRTSRITKNTAIPIDHLQPDFIIEDGFADLVIAVPWRVPMSYAMEELEVPAPHKTGQSLAFLPIVIGPDGDDPPPVCRWPCWAGH